MIRTKLWGTCETLIDTPTLKVDRIYGLAGGASSLHRHMAAHNLFCVQRGVLDLFIGDILWKRLAANQSLVVPAGNWHRMAFALDTEAIEVYYPEPGGLLLPEDICRRPGENGELGWAPGGAPVTFAMA